MSKARKQNFVQGATILMASMIMVKIVGAIFKIPLGSILTESGYAYFSVSYNLFTALYALTVTGLTTAVARMVATCAAKGRYRDCRNILKIAQRIFIILGILGTLIMFFCSKAFARASEADSAFYAIMVMSPAVFLSCMMASYRGYYEGLRNMIPSAVSEVVEVVTKLITGLLFSFLTLRLAENQYDSTGKIFGIVVKASQEGAAVTRDDVIAAALPFAAAGAMLGVTLSIFAGLLYVYITFKLSGDGFTKEDLLRSPKPVRNKAVVYTLIKTALPVTLSAVVTNLTNMIDLFSIMNRLEHSYEVDSNYFDSVYGPYLKMTPGTKSYLEELKTYIYGGYNMAISIFNLVPAFTGLFGRSALPNVTAAWVSGDRRLLKNNVESVIRMTALVAFPAGVGMCVIADRIAALLYNRPGVLVSVAEPLRLLGIAAIFLALIAPLYSILQAMGRFDLPVKFMLVGATLKLGTNFLLGGIPQINIKGAAIGTAICYSVILIFCLIALSSITNLRFNYAGIFGKIFLSAALCGGTAFLVSRISESKIVTLLAVGMAAVVYLLAVLFLRVLPESDILMLPKGAKIAKWMKRHHMLGK